MKVAVKPPKVKLQVAYEDIINRLATAGITYETENNIIQNYDENARDESGNPFPKPAENTIGTGTAWIKYYNKDRLQGYVFFCCHIIDCTACDYNRYITVYNYADDVIDTNLRGMDTVITVEPYPDDNVLRPKTLYYKVFTETCEFNVVKTGNVNTAITLFQLYADFNRDASKNPIPLTKYNTSIIPISSLSEIDTTKDADEKLFALPTIDQITGESILTSVQFYQTNAKDCHGKYIPIPVICDIVDLNRYNITGKDSLTGEIMPVTNKNYENLLAMSLNYTTHCDMRTFLDTYDTEAIWQYMQCRDKNMAIIPSMNSLYIAKSDKYINFSMTDPQQNWFSFTNINSKKIAADYSPLDGEAKRIQYASVISEHVPITLDDSASLLPLQKIDDRTTASVKLNESGVPTVDKCDMMEFDHATTVVMDMEIKFSLTPVPESETIASGGLHYKFTALYFGYDKRSEHIEPIFTDFNQKEFNLDITPQVIVDETVYPHKTTYIWPKTASYKLRFDCDIPENMSFCRICFPVSCQMTGDIYSEQTIDYQITAISNTRLDEKDITDINYMQPIAYDYNGLKEGAFRYYQPLYNSMLDGFIFYKYEDNVLKLDNLDTYENQENYSDTFINTLSQYRLKSIYVKEAQERITEICPECEGHVTETICERCRNTGKISDYKRPACPTCYSDSGKRINADIRNRCRTCAGTGDKIRYLYYNCYEFKDLSEYSGKIPLPADIEVAPTVDEIKNLMVTAYIAKTGETVTWPYLNYLLYKQFDINAGNTLDDRYIRQYRWIMYNVVFYKYAGQITKYFYWNGKTHVEVRYGHNFIYSVKTFTDEEWTEKKNDCHDGTILYKINPAVEKLDDYIAFYAYEPGDIGLDYGQFKRIYFNKEHVFNGITNDMSFNAFNMFDETRMLIKNDTHIHIRQDDPSDIILNEKYMYKYVMNNPVTCNNISFEKLVEQEID